MAIGGTGPNAVAAIWTMTGITLAATLLRNYARIWIIRGFGMDDYIYNFAMLLLLVYAICETMSATWGLGQWNADLTIHEQTKAMMWGSMGYPFAVLGMAVAKASFGVFLLRLVAARWHMLVILVPMVLLLLASIVNCFLFMLQCTPPAALWDPTIEGSYCAIDAGPITFLVCVFCVLVDFIYALFPWVFIGGIQMDRREKVVVLISMSLGVISGACGIRRTIDVPELAGVAGENYLRNCVGLIVWSAAEIAATMICIAIPICRPLYKGAIDRLIARRRDSSYHKHLNGTGSAPGFNYQHALVTVGGTPMVSNKTSKTNDEERQISSHGEGVAGGVEKGKSRTRTSVMDGRSGQWDNRSNEAVLGVRVTEEYHVREEEYE